MNTDDPAPASAGITPAKNVTPEQFAKMEQEIYEFWPTASHLPKDAATVSAFDYAERLIRQNPVKETDARRVEFRDFLKTKIEPLLGKEIAESVHAQLATNHSIGTAQHYVPLTPKTLNATLLASLAYFNRTETDRKNLVVLGCSGISFNNHWYPRGYLFHSLIQGQFVENQLNFFGRAFDATPVISAKAYNKETYKQMNKTILHLRSEKLMKKKEFNLLLSLLDEALFTPQVLSQKLYIDQLTIINFYLWQRMFASYSGTVPNLVFLSQEKIAAELLKEFHMDNTSTLHEVLFNTKWHDLIYKHFNNIMCAFSLERNYGTFLFWAMKGDNRIQLFAHDGILSSNDGTISYKMEPEVIKAALAKDELVPSTMLTFLVLSMYYGFFLSGGLDQPTYLTQTKHAYIAMLKELGMTDEVAYCEPVMTEDIVISRPSLAFLDGPHNQRVPASSIDMLIYGNQNSWNTIMEASKNVPLKHLLYRLYPELYRDYCEHETKDEELLKITERDIERFTGVDQEIPAWATLSNPMQQGESL